MGDVRRANLKGQFGPIRRPIDIGHVVYLEKQPDTVGLNFDKPDAAALSIDSAQITDALFAIKSYLRAVG